MNIQAIRQRFSLFLKQFRIEDLKLLMKFLEIIVNEYKNSRASRLFDLLSETPNIDLEEFNLEYDENISDDYNDHKIENFQAKFKNGSSAKLNNEKYRRIKLLNARKRLHCSISNRRSYAEKDNNNGNFKKVSTKEITDTSNDPSVTSTNKEYNECGNLQENNNLKETNYEDDNSMRSNVVKDNLSSEKEDDYSMEQVNEQELIDRENVNEEKNYIKNRPALRLIDSTKKFSKSYTYNDTGLNNDHSNYSNQNMNYLNEESIDRMFDTNSTDGYVENEENTATTSFINSSKNSASHWMLKRSAQSIESGMVNNLKELNTPMVKGVTKCAVCSDAASGTRYGVCVCEGCKEFFRRQRENTSHRLLYCVNGTNSCAINVNNRTQCRKCRLDKCIKLGMKLVGK